MLKLIEFKSNTIDPAELTIIEIIIKLVKYGVKSGNSIWAQSNNTQKDVYNLTSVLSSKTLEEINLILRSTLGLEVDRDFVLRNRPIIAVELSDRLKNIVNNLFGSEIYKVRNDLNKKDFYNKCKFIHEIMTKNISYIDFDILDTLETRI